MELAGVQHIRQQRARADAPQLGSVRPADRVDDRVWCQKRPAPHGDWFYQMNTNNEGSEQMITTEVAGAPL